MIREDSIDSLTSGYINRGEWKLASNKNITKEFKINKFITLKFENNRTNIYVNGKIFIHCKYLLMNLENNDFPDYDEIESIDEAIKLYSKKNETNKMLLDPEEEFIGHCSNLQVWCEYDYNLNILHSSLSFALLGALVKAGDKKAEISMKEEVLERINKGNEKIIEYFMNEDYLSLFTYEELNVLFEEIDIDNQDLLKQINKLLNSKYINEQRRKKGHLIIKFENRTT